MNPAPLPATDWLAAQARSHPHRPALVWQERTWTFAQLSAEVDRFTAGLQALGVRPGDRVALWRVPRPVNVRLVWAVARAGAVLVPFHNRWRAREYRQAWDLTRPHLTVFGEPPPLNLGRAAAWETLWEAGTDRDPQRPPLAPLQGLVFTSGSTGRVKAAALGWKQHFWNAWASAARLGLSPRDAWLLNLPLYHVGGLAVLWRCALYGIPVVLPAEEGPFRGESLRAVARYPVRPSLLSLVPTMLYRALQAGVEPWPELRVVLVGGARAAEGLVNEALQAGWPVALTYGLTEAASQVATARPETVRRRPGTVGHPLPFVQVEIRDEGGRPLPAGQVGEIVVRGPTVFYGYWGDAQATRRVLRGGWLHTGDMGYLDEEGRLWVQGRGAFCINTGGEKVYPEEVEAILMTAPQVAEVGVVGLPDPQWGEAVAAAVVWKAGAPGDLSRLQAVCRQHLAPYKCPKHWFVLPRLPRRPSGKLDRIALRQQLLETLAQRRATSPAQEV